MNQSEAALNQLISNNPKSPEVRDLYPYIISQSQLSKEDIPKRKYILSEWMPEDSFGMIYANRGVGKSWFCMTLAVAIAKGDPTFLGWEIHNKHSVLYIDGEMAKIELKERFDQLTDNNLNNLFLLSSETLYRDGKPICLDEPNEQEAIDNALSQLEAKNSRPQIIILDNLSTLRKGINENDNNDTEKLIEWLISLRHRQYSIILVHHAGKSGQQRGASKIEDPMDYVIKLEQTKDKNQFIHEGAYFDFSFDKIRTKMPNPSEGKLSLRQDSNGILKLMFSHPKKMPDRRFLILSYLKTYEGKGSITVREISDKFHISIGTAHSDRKELVKQNFLDKKHQVTKEGEKILFEIWPDKFKEPLELDLVHKDDYPF